VPSVTLAPRIRKTRRCTVAYWPHVHVFVWRHGLCFGFHVRYRRADHLWRHHRLVAFEPNKRPKGRGTLTWEWVSWVTTHADRGTAPFRVGLKTFVRLKVGFGGTP
jgi:hypothetical protein